MAFTKRNIAIGRNASSDTEQRSNGPQGVRPSPLSSHPVTSTGTSSLDDLLGSHGGLALGSSMLIEESGTTDFAGALLRFYAAEGISQGHVLHVVGVGEPWIRELPGLSESGSRSGNSGPSQNEDDKMKIAWRYEGLGRAGERGVPDRMSTAQSSTVQAGPFCHTFDLTKRLAVPKGAAMNSIPTRQLTRPFDGVLQSLMQSIKSSPPTSVHRLVIPTILSPAMWPPIASRPEHFIRFFHSLRSLLSQYPGRLTAMMSLPLELHSRSSGLVRWAEHLSDGVLELTPFPHLMDSTNALTESGGARSTEEQPQGMLKAHKLPIVTDRGGGGAGGGNTLGEDLAFTVSRRKFLIKPFSLPPLDGDQEAQKDAGKLTSKDVEF